MDDVPMRTRVKLRNQYCPKCHEFGVDVRKSKLPMFRCKNCGWEFD